MRLRHETRDVCAFVERDIKLAEIGRSGTEREHAIRRSRPAIPRALHEAGRLADLLRRKSTRHRLAGGGTSDDDGVGEVIIRRRTVIIFDGDERRGIEHHMARRGARELESERLRALRHRVVIDGKRERLARLPRREIQRAAKRIARRFQIHRRIRRREAIAGGFIRQLIVHRDRPLRAADARDGERNGRLAFAEIQRRLKLPRTLQPEAAAGFKSVAKSKRARRVRAALGAGIKLKPQLLPTCERDRPRDLGARHIAPTFRQRGGEMIIVSREHDLPARAIRSIVDHFEKAIRRSREGIPDGAAEVVVKVIRLMYLALQSRTHIRRSHRPLRPRESLGFRKVIIRRSHRESERGK